MKRKSLMQSLLLLCMVAGTIQAEPSLSWGGYGEIVYSKGVGGDTQSNAVLDAQRIILMTVVDFTERTGFTAELEFEHADETFVEQAYLDHRFSRYFTWRSGVLILPAGYINVRHEPMNFPTVQRPMIDKSIIPSTWREIGTGFYGSTMDASLSWEMYLINGLKSYDEGGKLGGSSGLRGGRQKASNSIMTEPGFAVALNWLSPLGIDLGSSFYRGGTQSTLFDGLDAGDAAASAAADSSVVDVSLFSVYGSGEFGALRFAAEYSQAGLGNSDRYNAFTGKDLGSLLRGYWAYVSYRLPLGGVWGEALDLFFMAEDQDLHAGTAGDLTANPSYHVFGLNYGLNWYLSRSVLVKADLSSRTTDAVEDMDYTFNLGLGFSF